MKNVINEPINNWFSLHRSEKIKIVESESPFSSERVKEIVRLSWNNSSDQYNQWDCLSRDEKNDLLESFKLEIKVFEYELKKGTMMNNKQVEEFAKKKWNSSCEWDSLEKDEKRAIIKGFKENLNLIGRLNNNDPDLSEAIKQFPSKQNQETIMLSEEQIKILIQIIDNTNFKGSDVGTIFELKCKLQAMQYEQPQKEETPS